MRTIKTILILVILLIAASLVYIYSGTYNIAATKPHSELATWIFRTAKKYSIQKHAEEIEEPDIGGEELVRNGFEHYDNMCSGCHGAPGSEAAGGFSPAPPDLVEKADKFRPAELFWVIKNGIKMTGMPEFGSTHSDDELWGIVAFIVKLPDVTAEQYKMMKEGSGNMGHEHNHQETGEPQTAPGDGNEGHNQGEDEKNRTHGDSTGEEI